MARDPVCGMDVKEAGAPRLAKDGRAYYFCSEHCLKKFAREQSISEKETAACLVQPRVKWYKNKNLIVTFVLILLSVLSYFLPLLGPFRKFLFMYLGRIWWAILLGLVLAGVMDYLVPREYVSKILARPRKSTIFYSVILGFFGSLCCHGVLALAIELHKKGASNPAVVSFLLASPWANFPFTIMLLGLFGPKALYIIASALLIAVTSGFIFQFLEAKGLIEKNKNAQEIKKEFFILKDLKARFQSRRAAPRRITEAIKGIISGSLSLADMVLWWILIGVGLASLSAAYIPPSIFQNYMGPTVSGLFVTLLVATVLEVCSEGTAPLAFEIYRQTQALGNAFVFLMAGVVTDYTEIGLLWTNVGKRVALWLPLVTVPQVVALGFLANIIF